MIRLNGSGGTLSEKLLSRALIKFNKEHGTSLTYEGVGSGAGVTNFFARKTNFASSDAAISSKNFDAYPDLAQFPYVAAALVMTYNLPELPSTTKLVLDQQTISQIYLGQITEWNDPSIAALNPGVELPKNQIKVFVRHDKSGTTENFVTSMFSSYASLTPTGGTILDGAASASIQLPDWCEGGGEVNVSKQVYYTLLTCTNGHKYYRAIGTEGVGLGVHMEPYGIGYVVYSEAILSKLSIANMVNTYGTVVEPSSKSIIQALMSTEGRLNANGRWSSVLLSNTNSTYSWPSVAAIYMVYQRETHIEDCEARDTLVEFFRWILLDQDFEKIANDMGFGLLSSYSRLSIMDDIKSRMKCGLNYNATSGTRTCDCVPVKSIEKTLPVFPVHYPDTLLNIMTVYSDQFPENIFQYQLSRGDTSLLSRVSLVEDFPEMDGMDDKLVLPLFANPLNIITNVESSIIRHVNLTRETLQGLFVGYVKKWDDSQVLIKSPLIKSVAGVTVVLDKKSSEMSKFLEQYLDISFDISGATIIETNSVELVPAAVFAIPGSIGLQWGSMNIPLSIAQINIVESNSNLRMNVSSLESCLKISDARRYSAKLDTTGCWPLVKHTYAVIDRSWNTLGDQKVAKTQASIVEWMSKNSLMPAASSLVNGTQRDTVLNEIRFDGMSLLSPEPLCTYFDIGYNVGECGKDGVIPVSFFWKDGENKWCLGGTALPNPINIVCDHVRMDSSMSSGLIGMIVALSIVNFVVFLILFLYQNTKIIIKSQKYFTLISVASAIVLNASTISLFGPNTDTSCSLRVILMSVSFTMAFAVLTMKLQRVNALFNARGMSKVKVTNRQVFLNCLAFFIIDVILLGIWWAIEPPLSRAIDVYYPETHVTLSTAQCTNHSAGVHIMVGWKLIILLVGVFYSIKTWNVSDEFSEARPLAVAIYNAILMGVLTYAFVMYLMKDNRPNQVLMLTLGACLTSTVAVMVVNCPKLWYLYQHPEERVSIIRSSGSSKGSTKQSQTKNSQTKNSENQTMSRIVPMKL
jgi:phosphate transport system substrate-binding protein